MCAERTSHSPFAEIVSQLTLPKDRHNKPCMSSLRIDGMGQQVHAHIYNRVVARALQLPFCAWRLVEPRQQTIKAHPRAGNAEWTNELNLCGLYSLPNNPVDSGDCGYALNCMGCSICNCPTLNATGHRARGTRNQILKATLLKMTTSLDTHVSHNHELWRRPEWGRAMMLAAPQVRDELLRQRAMISASLTLPSCPMYQLGLTHVAMHARRGDIMTNDKKVHRRVPDNHYHQLLSRVHKVLKANRVAHALHLFSDGNAVQFASMTSGLPSVRLHLNGDDFQAWHCLGHADLLLTSGSGAYSETAAFFASEHTHVLYSQWTMHHMQATHKLGRPIYRGEQGDSEDVSANYYEQVDARFAALLAAGLGWHKVLSNGTVEGEDEYVHALRRRARHASFV